VYAHGLDLTVRNPVYRTLWLPFVRRAHVVVVNSSATRDLAISMGVEPARLQLVHPGVDIPSEFAKTHAEQFRTRHGLGNAPVLISVGRLTARKGVLEFVRDALPTIAAQAPNVMLVVIGDAPANALAAKAQSIDSIRQAAQTSGVAKHVKFLGTVSEDELQAAYASASIHVFPVRHIPNDPEGFGMVAIEAAAHGVPTVAYRNGGVPDAVSDEVSGHLVAPGDAEAFAEAVVDLMHRPLTRERIVGFSRRFAWERIGDQLAAVLGLASNGPTKAPAPIDASNR